MFNQPFFSIVYSIPFLSFIRKNLFLSLALLLVLSFLLLPPITVQAGTCTQYYQVQAGDDIYRISAMYGQNWQTLATLNGLSYPYSLYAGQSLCIFSSDGTEPYNNYNNNYSNYYYNNYGNYGNYNNYGNYGNYGNYNNYGNYGSNNYPYTYNASAATVYANPIPYNNISPTYASSYYPASSSWYNYYPVSDYSTPYPYYSAYGYNNPNYTYPYQSNYTAYSYPYNCLQNYTVQPGDTLYRIGVRYGINWGALAKANNLYYPYTVYAGQTLCISSSYVSPPTPPNGCRTYHTVQSGQNLYRVGLIYGVSWTYLAWLNNLSNPNAVYYGQRLCVVQ